MEKQKKVLFFRKNQVKGSSEKKIEKSFKKVLTESKGSARIISVAADMNGNGQSQKDCDNEIKNQKSA